MVVVAPGKHVRKDQNQQRWIRRVIVIIFVVITVMSIIFWLNLVKILQTSSPSSTTERTNTVKDGKTKPSSNRQTRRDVVSNNAKSAPVAADAGAGAGASTTSVATVGYAVSVTGCGSDPITEGGAVLKHSIHRVSSRGNASSSKYDYKLYAIYHPDAKSCAVPLEKLGYTLLERKPFVNIEDIEGQFLREKIASNGCCGEKELIKFEAYTLTEHPIVVHLDLDVLVLKPMDEIFDMMMYGPPPKSSSQKISEAIMWPEKPLPERIDAFFTYDYNMVPPKKEYKPVQGGFLVLRPSQIVYEEIKEIVRVGDFRDGGGWGGKVGPFYGSMTFQGLVPYYYDVLHVGTAVELSRCIYNQMCDNPRTGKTVNDIVSGDCRTGEDDCEDCRSRLLEDVVTVHYTLCQKPWWCTSHATDAIQHRLCRKLVHEWYKVRSELEQSWGRSGKGPGTWEESLFYGYCKHSGKKGYVQIEEPFGKAI